MNSVNKLVNDKLVNDDHEYYCTSKLGDCLLDKIPYGWRMYYLCHDAKIWCYSKYQQIRYGVSNKECWSLTHTFTDFILPRLKHFKKMKRNAYPSDLTLEQWEEILDELIWTFEYIQDDGMTINSFPILIKNESLDAYFSREKTKEEKHLIYEWQNEYNKLEERKDRGLGLFAKYYHHLWD